MAIKKLSGRALVVDDQEDLGELLGSYLTMLGLEVDIVNEGGAALNMLAGAHYDYLVTDLEMPGMSGRELVEEANRRGMDGTKVVFFSGDTEASLAGSKEIQEGGFLKKPFVMNDIVRAITGE